MKYLVRRKDGSVWGCYGDYCTAKKWANYCGTKVIRL